MTKNNKSNNKNNNKNTRKKRKQSGGSYTIEELLTHYKYDKIKELLIAKFQNNQSLIDLNRSLLDPFIQNETTDFYNWYISKNPNFLNIVDIDIDDKPLFIPEFNTLIAGICKDLLIMLNQRVYNDSNETNENKKHYAILLNNSIKKHSNNILKINKTQSSNDLLPKEYYNHEKKSITQKKSIVEEEKTKYISKVINKNSLNETEIKTIIDLLNSIETVINEGYRYKTIIMIYTRFLKFTSLDYSKCDSIFEHIIFSYNNTPFIIFPTYYNLDYKNVILLCRAPIINFRFMNRRRLVHKLFYYPCGQIDHDLFHSNTSHNFDFRRFKIDIKTLKTHFTNINTFINSLLVSFNYNLKLSDETKILENTNYENIDNENIKKQCIALLIFYLLHEHRSIPSINFTKKNLLDGKYDEIDFTELITTLQEDKRPKKFHRLLNVNWMSVYAAFKQIIITL
jgi:hypothetical protein